MLNGARNDTVCQASTGAGQVELPVSEVCIFACCDIPLSVSDQCQSAYGLHRHHLCVREELLAGGQPSELERDACTDPDQRHGGTCGSHQRLDQYRKAVVKRPKRTLVESERSLILGNLGRAIQRARINIARLQADLDDIELAAGGSSSGHVQKMVQVSISKVERGMSWDAYDLNDGSLAYRLSNKDLHSDDQLVDLFGRNTGSIKRTWAIPPT